VNSQRTADPQQNRYRTDWMTAHGSLFGHLLAPLTGRPSQVRIESILLRFYSSNEKNSHCSRVRASPAKHCDVTSARALSEAVRTKICARAFRNNNAISNRYTLWPSFDNKKQHNFIIKRYKLQFGLQTEKLPVCNNFKWKVVIKYFDKQTILL